MDKYAVILEGEDKQGLRWIAYYYVGFEGVDFSLNSEKENNALEVISIIANLLESSKTSVIKIVPLPEGEEKEEE